MEESSSSDLRARGFGSVRAVCAGLPVSGGIAAASSPSDTRAPAAGDVEAVGLVTTFNEAVGRVAMHGVRIELVRHFRGSRPRSPRRYPPGPT